MGVHELDLSNDKDNKAAASWRQVGQTLVRKKQEAVALPDDDGTVLAVRAHGSITTDLGQVQWRQ